MTHSLTGFPYQSACLCFFVCRFAFQYNPSLQPRALVVFGCISKRVTHGQIKQIIRILSKVSPSLICTQITRYISTALENSFQKFTKTYSSMNVTLRHTISMYRIKRPLKMNSPFS